MESNLTIFSTPKKFVGEFDQIQRKSFSSWSRITNPSNVIIFSEEPTIKTIANEFKFKYISKIKKSRSGVPLISDIFYQAKKIAKTNIIMYTNSDMLYSKELIRAVEVVKRKFSKFLLVGRRLDVDNQDNSTGKLHSPYGIDYFVFTKNSLPKMPEFLIARQYWDTWTLRSALNSNIPLIDATYMINAIHQNHSYNNMKGGLKNPEFLKDVEINKKLSKGEIASINDSTYILTYLGLFKKPKYVNDFYSLVNRLWQITSDTYEHRIKTGNFTRPWSK